jgi:putative transposase
METTGRYRRRSLRMLGYDYASPGAYFVTLCTKDRECLFGGVVDGEMRLNEVGRIVQEEWGRSAAVRAEIELDCRVVMPNHVHGIIVVADARTALYSPARAYGSSVGAYGSSVGAYGSSVGAYGHTPLRSPSKTVGAVVRGFKSAATKRINEIRGTPGVLVWQRNYYEHVIRDEDSLGRIRRYIAENPARWGSDRENPMP